MNDFTLDSVIVAYAGTSCVRNEMHVSKVGDDEYVKTTVVTESLLNSDGLTSSNKILSETYDIMTGAEVMDWVNNYLV